MYLYNLLRAILMFLVPILTLGGLGILGGSMVLGIRQQKSVHEQ